MSDGPFACIKMRRAWQSLLEKADNNNFGPHELRRDLVACLKGDWSEDVPTQLIDQVRRITDNAAQSSLFGNDGVRELARLKDTTAGSPFAELFVECAIQALREGHVGDDGATEAIANAGDEWLARCFRGVEEHCVNENVDRARAFNVRARLNEAAADASSELAQHVLGLTGSAGNQAPAKRRGLDDGVPLNGGH